LLSAANFNSQQLYVMRTTINHPILLPTLTTNVATSSRTSSLQCRLADEQTVVTEGEVGIIFGMKISAQRESIKSAGDLQQFSEQACFDCMQ
jgi:hypothetical protein